MMTLISINLYEILERISPIQWGEIEAKPMCSGRDGDVAAFSARNIALLSGSMGASQLFLLA